jgi:hypothetical protein
MILEKNPPVAKGVKTQKQIVTRLMGNGLQARLIEHTMVMSFDVSLTSPEKGSSVIFHV